MLTIAAAKGDYTNTPTLRSYQVTLYGQTDTDCFTVNGKPTTVIKADDKLSLKMTVSKMDIRKDITIQACDS